MNASAPNDAYIVNPIDKEIIAAAVVSHSSSRDIAQEVSRFSKEEIIGKHRARPAVIAALVRLADELDEDHRRADPILQKRLELPAESSFFWLFCQRVRGVRPDLTSKRIEINLALEKADTTTYGPVPGGKVRHFVAFVAEKLAKINEERVLVNRFLPPELQYAGLHVEVKPLREHPKWKTPKTFVFNDRTTPEMFLQSYPELLSEPTNKSMEGVLKLIREGQLDNAEDELNRLASVIDDLPAGVQLRIPYDQACIYSMRSSLLPAGPVERENALDQAARALVEWFKRGQTGAFESIGRTAEVEVHEMARDPDLRDVRWERSKILRDAIPPKHWPVPGGGGGCVPFGTFVDTPRGKRRVELLQEGDEVESLRFEHDNDRVIARVIEISVTRSSQCIRLNERWLVTPTQPLRTQSEWLDAAEIKYGDTVVDGDGNLVQIFDIEVLNGEFDVFDLTIDNPCHNYIANGLLCHAIARMGFVTGS